MERRTIPARAVTAVALAAVAAVALAACSASGGASPSGAPASSASAAPSATLEGTAWQLTDYIGPGGNSLAVPEKVAATAMFDAGTVAGNGGCNQYTGPYTVDGDKLTIGTLASTMMACPAPQDAVEKAFLAALGKAATYTITGDTLEIKTAEGKVGLRFSVAQAPSLTKTRWVATTINNGRGGAESVVAGSTVTAIFAEDGTVGGNAGCNTYNGPYTVDGAAIKVGPLVSTKMACADEATSQQEAAYLAALGNATVFAFSGDNLELRDAGGALQVQYQPTLP
jgi:heat shock protein HslJ